MMVQVGRLLQQVSQQHQVHPSLMQSEQLARPEQMQHQQGVQVALQLLQARPLHLGEMVVVILTQVEQVNKAQLHQTKAQVE
jgi:hypothetical protein